MKKQLSIWKLIANSLQNQVPVTLLYVLESKGSSPGRQGFFMAVNTKAEMAGSIGGGIMEHKFVKMAREQLEIENPKTQIRKQIHDKSETRDRSGMICSGEQTVLIYPVNVDDLEHIKVMIDSLEENRNGMLELSTKGIRFSNEVPPVDFDFKFNSESNWSYREKTGYKYHLYIIGGGHCALAFSKIMSMMDFYIHVFDEREGLNTMEQNHDAHEKKLIDSYEQLKNLVPSGNDRYVVIMTFGYRTDDIALRALMDKQFKYLGLLGSKKKIEEMFQQLRMDGIPETVLKNIHSPIGIAIKSQTPEEIAISIAAEIIAVKNG